MVQVIAAEGPHRVYGNAEFAGGFRDAHGGRIHDAGLEQHGQPIARRPARILHVQIFDAARFDQAVDQEH